MPLSKKNVQEKRSESLSVTARIHAVNGVVLSLFSV
jgi:hypothetical protein